MNPLFVVTAVIEAATGLALIAAPEFVVRLLLGAELAGPGVPLGRLAGAALLALGVACWLARDDARSSAAKALLAAMGLYNVGAAIVLGTAGFTSPNASALLWLAVGLHTILALWCARLGFGAGTRAG
jgi:hypothetical protein